MRRWRAVSLWQLSSLYVAVFIASCYFIKLTRQPHLSAVLHLMTVCLVFSMEFLTFFSVTLSLRLV